MRLGNTFCLSIKTTSIRPNNHRNLLRDPPKDRDSSSTRSSHWDQQKRKSNECSAPGADFQTGIAPSLDDTQPMKPRNKQRLCHVSVSMLLKEERKSDENEFCRDRQYFFWDRFVHFHFSWWKEFATGSIFVWHKYSVACIALCDIRNHRVNNRFEM